MKTFFTLSFALFFSTFSFSQYESLLGSENTSWDMAVTASGIFAPPIWDSCYVANDTMINGLKYVTVLWKFAQYTHPNEARGYLREDTILGKAWYLDETTEEEYLIQDLSLGVGDTFYITHYPGQPSLGILVDSIYLFDGKKYVQFDYENQPGGKFSMIEGVGTNYGLKYQDPNFVGLLQYFMLCQTKNDTLSYVNNSPFYLGNCDATNVGVEDVFEQNASFVLYPNPASHSLSIDWKGGIQDINKKPIPIEIYNLTGQLVSKRTAKYLPEKIDVSALPKGVYLIKVGENGQSKFIKE